MYMTIGDRGAYRTVAVIDSRPEAPMQSPTFRDRTDAGRRLAEALLLEPRQEDLMVLALPRGGVPVAVEVARALGVGLDVLVVRKLGHPLQPELAVGAVAAGGVRVVNPEFEGTIPAPVLDEITAHEASEVDRRSRLYRGDSPPLDLRQRAVILVDDGLATGATMMAAVFAAKAAGARHVTVAVPVGDGGVCSRLAAVADRVVCLLQPMSLVAVGYWYDEFNQLTDDDVRALLDTERRAKGSPRAQHREIRR
jgi:putative phosphoribosyl transferase